MEKLFKLLENPTMAQTIVSSLVEEYKPTVYALGNEVLNVYKDFAENTEYTDAKAKARKNQYDSYIKVGFTHEEAMSLLLTDIRKTAELVQQSSNRKSK